MSYSSKYEATHQAEEFAPMASLHKLSFKI